MSQNLNQRDILIINPFSAFSGVGKRLDTKKEYVETVEVPVPILERAETTQKNGAFSFNYYVIFALVATIIMQRKSPTVIQAPLVESPVQYPFLVSIGTFFKTFLLSFPFWRMIETFIQIGFVASLYWAARLIFQNTKSLSNFPTQLLNRIAFVLDNIRNKVSSLVPGGEAMLVANQFLRNSRKEYLNQQEEISFLNSINYWHEKAHDCNLYLTANNNDSYAIDATDSGAKIRINLANYNVVQDLIYDCLFGFQEEITQKSSFLGLPGASAQNNRRRPDQETAILNEKEKITRNETFFLRSLSSKEEETRQKLRDQKMKQYERNNPLPGNALTSPSELFMNPSVYRKVPILPIISVLAGNACELALRPTLRTIGEGTLSLYKKPIVYSFFTEKIVRVFQYLPSYHYGKNSFFVARIKNLFSTKWKENYLPDLFLVDFLPNGLVSFIFSLGIYRLLNIAGLYSIGHVINVFKNNTWIRFLNTEAGKKFQENAQKSLISKPRK
jgi:hypothetical protein